MGRRNEGLRTNTVIVLVNDDVNVAVADVVVLGVEVVIIVLCTSKQVQTLPTKVLAWARTLLRTEYRRSCVVVVVVALLAAEVAFEVVVEVVFGVRFFSATTVVKVLVVVAESSSVEINYGSHPRVSYECKCSLFNSRDRCWIKMSCDNCSSSSMKLYNRLHYKETRKKAGEPCPSPLRQ